MQGVIEDVLFRIRGERERVALTVAGRTDRGVHATGQVASHPGAPAEVYTLNAMLPHDVSVLASEAAPDGFDARRDAISRTYRYRLFTRREPSPFEHLRALHHPQPIDEQALHQAAALLVGTHDFTAFTPTETAHVRFERVVLSAAWEREAEHVLTLQVTGDAFMRNMIRVLIGTMLEVGTGKRSLDDFAALLTGRPREEAGVTAVPHGLYFTSVDYGT